MKSLKDINMSELIALDHELSQLRFLNERKNEELNQDISCVGFGSICSLSELNDSIRLQERIICGLLLRATSD